MNKKFIKKQKMYFGFIVMIIYISKIIKDNIKYKQK